MSKKKNKRAIGAYTLTSGGRVRVQVTVGKKADGKPFRVSKTFNTREEAKNWANEQKYEYSTKRKFVEGNILFIEHAYKWLEHLKDTQITNKTYQGYESSLINHIIPYFGKMKLNDIRTGDINDFIRHLRAKGLANASIYQIKAALRSCFKLAVVEDKILKNPVIYSLPLGKEATHRKSIPTGDMKRILSAARGISIVENTKRNHGRNFYFYYFLAISYYTGMRPGEVLALRWQDINLDRKIIYVNSAISEAKDFRGDGKTKNVIGRPKTAKSIRPIGITNKLLAILKELPREKDGEFVIKTINNTPIPPSAMRRTWGQLLTSIGLGGKYLMYEIRHTYATNLTMMGLPVADVSRQLGHTDIRTTLNYYIHTGEESTRAITDKINQMM